MEGRIIEVLLYSIVVATAVLYIQGAHMGFSLISNQRKNYMGAPILTQM